MGKRSGLEECGDQSIYMELWGIYYGTLVVDKLSVISTPQQTFSGKMRGNNQLDFSTDCKPTCLEVSRYTMSKGNTHLTW